jgi:hypothetical protein
MRKLLEDVNGLVERFKKAKMPRLLMPIRKFINGGEGYVAMIEDTPEHRQLMGKDGCNWVKCLAGEITCGFDWEPVT